MLKGTSNRCEEMMAEIRRDIIVRGAHSMVAGILERFWASHVSEGAVRLKLRAAGFEHEVTATIRPATLREEHYGAFEHFDVAWDPHDARYPLFSGSLHVIPVEDTYTTLRVELKGHYEPPLGIVGRAFDAALGHRIAEATADALLDELRIDIEREYEEIEARKRTGQPT